jgi:hypothetical protein
VETALTAPARRARPALLCAALAGALAAALTACGSGEGRSDDELSGLVHAPKPAPATVDVQRASRDVAELMRAATLTHAQVGALLGAHTVTGRSHTEVDEKSAVIETIDDEMGIELDAKGNFHAQVDNSKEYGRDVYLVDGWLYQRPRYGKFHRRRPNDDGEPARIRGEIFGSVAATLDLLAPGVDLTAGGEATIAGRKGRAVKLTPAREPRKPPHQTLAQRKWRESVTVRDAGGELVLDAKTGVVLRAVLQGTVSFQRDGRTFQMRLETRQELGSFGAVEEVAPPSPELVVMETDQRHELDERDSLLEGIAPRAARARSAGAPQ